MFFKFPTSIKRREEIILIITNCLKIISTKKIVFSYIIITTIFYFFLKDPRDSIKEYFILTIVLSVIYYILHVSKNYTNDKIRDALDHEESMNFISDIVPKVTVTVGDTGAGKDTFNNALIHADVFRMINDDYKIMFQTKKILFQMDFIKLELDFLIEYKNNRNEWFMEIPNIKKRDEKIVKFLEKNNFFLKKMYKDIELYQEYKVFLDNPELKLKYGKFNGYWNQHYIDMLIQYIYCLNRIRLFKNKVWSNHPIREPTGLMAKILSERNLNINDADLIPLLPEKGIFVQTEISSIQGNHLDNISSIVKNTGRTHAAAYRRHIFGEEITWRAANQDPGRQVKAMRELEHSFIQIIAKIEIPGDASCYDRRVRKQELIKNRTKSNKKKLRCDKTISSLLIQKERYEFDYGMTEFVIHVSKSAQAVKSVNNLSELSDMVENKEYMLGKSYSCKLRIRTAVAKGYHNPWYLSGLKDILDEKSKLHYSKTPNWHEDMKLHPPHIKYLEQATMKQMFGLGALTKEDKEFLELPNWYETGQLYKNIEVVKTADKRALAKIKKKEQKDKESPNRYLVQVITTLDVKYVSTDSTTLVSIGKATLFDTETEAKNIAEIVEEQINKKNEYAVEQLTLDVKVRKATSDELIKILEKKYKE